MCAIWSNFNILISSFLQISLFWLIQKEIVPVRNKVKGLHLPHSVPTKYTLAFCNIPGLFEFEY